MFLGMIAAANQGWESSATYAVGMAHVMADLLLGSLGAILAILFTGLGGLLIAMRQPSGEAN